MLENRNLSVIFTLFASVVMLLSTTCISQAETRYDNDFPVRAGIYYGSGSKTEYNISGKELSILDGTYEVIETDEDSLKGSLINTVYIS
ncbi:MAG: hypothetical protein WBH44_08185, partial [Proteocatella sp.]